MQFPVLNTLSGIITNFNVIKNTFIEFLQQDNPYNNKEL